MGDFMRCLKYLALLVAISVSGSAFCEDKIVRNTQLYTHTSNAAGIGIRTCAQFAKSYQANPEDIEEMTISWLQGYLTALNIFYFDPRKTKMQAEIGSLNWSLIFDETVSYCKDNPLAHVYEYTSIMLKNVKYTEE